MITVLFQSFSSLRHWDLFFYVVFNSLWGLGTFLRNKLAFILGKVWFSHTVGLDSIFWIKEWWRLPKYTFKTPILKKLVDPLYFKNRLFDMFPMHITVILAFKLILNKILYNISTHIKNSIDKLIIYSYMYSLLISVNTCFYGPWEIIPTEDEHLHPLPTCTMAGRTVTVIAYIYVIHCKSHVI
jgi:hypothetical protein